MVSMKTLRLAALAALSACCFCWSAALKGADLPDEMESRIQRSPTVVKLQADLEAVKRHVAARDAGQPCPCGPNCPCCAACPGKNSVVPTPTSASGCTATVVRRADGTCVCRICEGNSCREVPCDCSQVAGGVTYPSSPFVLTSGGGCASCGSQSFASPYGGPVMVMGDSGGGGCASGECGSSGRSGRRGRRGR
jgi:hypothetical protein